MTDKDGAKKLNVLQSSHGQSCADQSSHCFHSSQPTEVKIKPQTYSHWTFVKNMYIVLNYRKFYEICDFAALNLADD